MSIESTDLSGQVVTQRQVTFAQQATPALLAASSNDTFQDFDLPTRGAPWVVASHFGVGARLPEFVEGGPFQ